MIKYILVVLAFGFTYQQSKIQQFLTKQQQPIAVNCSNGLQKFYSIDPFFDNCGESCIDPKSFWVFKIFEPTLAQDKSTNTPCANRNYTKYINSPTHGVYPIQVTLDLYAKENKNDVNTTPVAINCQEGYLKYYSVVKENKLCGECCIKHQNFWAFKIFEPNLAQDLSTNTPCAERNYKAYNSTVTHGVWPVKISLDLYGEK